MLRFRFPRLFLSLLICAAVCSAQITPLYPQSSAEKFTLTGSVANAVTGEPIKRALVEIYSQQPRAILTDMEGNFQIDNVPGGGYSIQARKPGFFPEAEISRGRAPNRVVTLTSETPPVVLKLFPEAVITGVITDGDGLPVPSISVRVMRQVVASGRAQWQQVQQKNTDENGFYRIAALQPGTYAVAAGPEAIVSTLPERSQAGRTGFAQTFYPSASDISSAAKLRLTAGQRIEANFSLAAEPFYRVQGTFSGDVAAASVMLVSASREAGTNMLPLTVNEGTNRFESREVPPGSYYLLANGTDSTGHPVVGRVPLQVRKDVLNAHVALQPTVSIPLEIEQRRLATKPRSRAIVTAGPPSFGYLQLTAKDNLQGVTSANLAANGLVGNVAPGQYTVQLSVNPPWYAESISCGNANLFTDPLSVVPSADQAPIRIVLSDDGAVLKPQLQNQSDTGGLAGTLLVIPESGTDGEIREFPMPARGEAYLPTLKPGSYALLVMDDVSDLEYRNPDVLAPLLSRATHVTLAPEQELSIRLELFQRRTD